MPKPSPLVPALREGTASTQPAAGPGAGGKLRRLAVRGSVLEILGYGGAQALRLGSNLVLTRLLFPEAFGLVALVNILNTGLIMFSDVGIEPAVVQSGRGEERAFLNTAWSIQVVRGFILYGVALLLAWPLALVYSEPRLTLLVCVGSVSVVFMGFHSTSLYTLRRRLQLGKLTLIELGSQAVAVAIMIPWAYLRPSVWPLVGGAVASAAFKAAASYAVDVGYRNRFEFERQARKAITDFGVWILAASAVQFVSAAGDRLLLGRFMGLAELGVYSIAVMLSEAMSTVVNRLSDGVLFPVLSRVREEGDERVRQVYRRARLALDAISMPALGVLTMLGPWVIDVLYDRRYATAGWMLQILAIRVAMICMLAPCQTCLFARGVTRYGLYRNTSRMVWILLAVPLGFYLFGLRGVVLAAGLSEVPGFFILWPAFRSHGLLRLSVEARGLAMYVGGLAAGWAVSLVLHP